MSQGAHVFAGGGLDRESERRRDPAWVEARLADPTSRFLALWHLQILVRSGEASGLAWATSALRELADREADAVLLGTNGGTAHFALDLSPLADPLAALGLEGAAEFADLRAIAPRLPAQEAGIAAQARSLVDWHARHRFCAACGERTEARQGATLRFCRDCKSEHFPRTDPVAIALVTRGERCLLGRQAGWPARMFSSLAGFVEPGETLEEAVRREVMEESGVRVGRVRYHSSQPWPFPSSLMLGCLAEAESEEIRIDAGEIEEARWFERETVRRALAAPDPARDALLLPPPLAIAHHLVRAWAES
jgi:NAD+ diphosphatase